MPAPIPYTPLSYVDLVGNGVNTAVTVPFPFLKRDHVGIYLGLQVATGSYTTKLVEGVGYTWTSDTLITLTTPIANGQPYTVRRVTPRDQLLVQFSDGSNLTARDLNTEALQILYVAQELSDATVAGSLLSEVVLETSLGGGDFGFERIANIAALPTAPTVGKLVELVDTTGVQGVATVVGEPAGFVGSPGLSARLRWAGTQWDWLGYAPLHPDGRYWLRTESPSGAAGLSGPVLNLLAVSDPNTPAGTIVWLQRAPTDPPAGWLHTNGVDKQRGQYNTLFNAIGTTYGNGDGTTTFGFPLQANLTNPFAPDASYNAFIRFGTRTSEPGELFVKYNTGTQLVAAFVDGLTVGATINITGATGLQTLASTNVGPSVSSDTLIVGCGSTNTTGRNVYLWKRSGSSFSLVNASPALAGTGATRVVSVSPDGNYAAVLTTAPNNVLFLYKGDAGKNNYTLIQSLTLSAPITQIASNTGIRWSRSSNFIGLWDTLSQYRLISRSGDVFTEATSYPVISPALSLLTSIDFDPTDNYVTLVAENAIHVLARAGNAYTVVTFFTYSGARGGFWNAAGNRIVCGTINTQILLLAFNGSTLTLAASGGAASDSIVLVRRTPNRLYTTSVNTLWSFANDTLTNLGSPSPATFFNINGISSGQSVE